MIGPPVFTDEDFPIPVAEALQWRASLPEPRPEILIWNDLQQRLIHGLRLPGYSEEEVRLVLGWFSTND